MENSTLLLLNCTEAQNLARVRKVTQQSGGRTCTQVAFAFLGLWVNPTNVLKECCYLLF